MQGFQLFFPSAEMTAGLWGAFVSDKITQHRRKFPICQKVLHTGIPLDKFPLHTEAEDIGKKPCFFLPAVAGIMLGAFFFDSFRNGIILHQQSIYLLRSHRAVIHHPKYIVFQILCQFRTISYFCVILRNFRTDSCLPRKPAADQSHIQHDWLRIIFQTRLKDIFQKLCLVRYIVIADISAKCCND